ncbi:MAG: phage holin family protein [Bacteroidales bacterium]|nr:phage holin family protein [Bacteroidales bacterium]
MDDFTRPVSAISNEFKRYINLRINYMGLALNKKLADFMSQIITLFVLAGVFSMVLLMLSFAFVFWYGSNAGTYYHGFLIVSLTYMLIGLIIYYFREPLLMNPLIKKLHSKHFEMTNEDGDKSIIISTKEDMEKYLEIMDLQIEQSELLMHKYVRDIGDALKPSNILNSLMTYALTSSNLMMSGALLVLRYMRKRKR